MKTIVKNALWLFSGQFSGRLVKAGLMIYAARVLGAASWGAFSYALSLATALTIFSDVGVNSLITRELVKKPESRLRYVSTAFFIKIFVLALLLSAAVIFRNHLTNLPEAAGLITIVIFIVLFDSFRDLGAAVSRSMEKMEIEALANFLTNLAIVVFGFLFLASNPTSRNLALGYALGTAFGFLVMLFFLRKHLAGIFSHFRKELVRPILSSALPFGIIGFMGPIMLNTDVLILGWLRSAEELGFYSAAQRPIQFLYAIPILIAAAFFPSLARLTVSKENFRRTFEQGLKLLFLLSLPMALGGAILAKPIIETLYTSLYLPAAQSFAVLSLTLAVVFPSVIVANAIFAYDKQKSFFIYAGLGVLGNAVLDLLLIPIFGIVGSALATLTNQIIINGYAWSRMKKINHFSALPLMTRILVAALGMGIFTFVAQESGLNFWLNFLASAGLYGGLLLILKEPMVKTILNCLEFKKCLPGKSGK